MTPTVRAQLLARAGDERPGLLFEDQVLKRELAAEGAVAGPGGLWTRAARGTAYS